MSSWNTYYVCRIRSFRKSGIPTLIILICLSCFLVIYSSQYGYRITSNIGKVVFRRGYHFDSPFSNASSYIQDRSDIKIDQSWVLSSSDQLRLWKKIVLPPEGRKQSFSFARHGDPIKLYSAGRPFIDVPKLVDSLTVDKLRYMLSHRQTRLLSGKDVNCRKLVRGGDTLEIKLPLTTIHNRTKTETERDSKRSGCLNYTTDYRYISSPITELEQSFPLAFSILVYTNFRQFERLLRMIYRPQNIYCIHVDKKSSKAFLDSVGELVKCFENVFITKRSVDVKWGEFSVLEPEMICMNELLRRHKTWKYFINLTGQEFPLRTNYELVKILDSIKGANLVEGTVERANRERWEMAGPPPHGITPVKGAIHVILNRQFVDYAINNKIAKDLLDWCRRVEIPDELFFSTLHNNPQLKIPGSYKGLPETNNDTNPHLARFKNWEEDWHCLGKYVRGICIFGVGDLPLLATREELFANKFHQDFQPATLDCLEEVLRNRTREEVYGTLVFNTDYYSTRDFVKNKV